MSKNFPKEINRSEQLNKGYNAERKFAENIGYHYHDFYEFELILSGEVTATVNGNVMKLSRGGAYLLRPTDLHEFSVDGKVELFTVHFLSEIVNGKIFDAFLNKNGYLTATFNENDCKFLTELISKLNLLTDKNIDLATASAIISLIISTMLSIGKEIKETLNDDDVYKAVRYLSNNFTLNPSLEETAKIAGLATTYFCRKFKTVTGKTFIEFLSSLKVDFASRLIERTKTPITEICFLSGFNSLSQFIREFKKIKGVTPSLLRQKALEKLQTC